MPLPATLPPALFVTGTDTEIGKTAASTALLHALRRRGLRAVGMKPVASGSEDLGQGLRNEDALALQAASWPVPDTLDQLDLVRALQLPVLLVVGMRLGCVNHARLTAQSLQASGVECLGWIGNHIDPVMQRQDENIATLQQRLPMPCWGRLPYLPGVDGEALSAYLLE